MGGCGVSRPSNHAGFLSAIFHAAQEGETGCIATVHTKADGTISFPAYAWPKYTAQDFHTHYGVGLHQPRDPKEFKKTGLSKFKRTKDTWKGMAALVLDDIGEQKQGIKIGVPDLEPSFIVETKPGSQQWGYILDAPLRDYRKAQLILAATRLVKFNDAFGQNPARLVRLPGSCPPGKKHNAMLVKWTGKHFTPDELIIGLKLDLKAAKEMTKNTGHTPLTQDDAAPFNMGDDPVLEWLDHQGLILGDRGEDGWIDMICPWHHEHTNGIVVGTGYRPPMSTDPYRSFHCFHRCSGVEYMRNTNVFLQWVRENGGPDVECLDDAALRERKEANKAARKGVPRGATDPVLMRHVKAARGATSKDVRAGHLNSVIWLLCDDGWGDAEIIRLLINAGLEGPDILKTTNWALGQIDTIRVKQDRAKARQDERAEKKPLTDDERWARFQRSFISLTNSEQEQARDWIKGELE